MDETTSTQVCAVCGGSDLGVHQICVCKVTEQGMARTKTTSSGDDTRAPKGDYPGQRAQTTSYRKSKMTLTRDLEHRPRMYKGRDCLFTRPPFLKQSFSSDLSEKDKEQAVKEEDFTEQESE
ncbi:hypothetical protein Scep_029517 [Stephania cephalantha]|uniref:Uncharacterized protein n=1 Tax=Stephania cephalantha TaxID=152367 RepID=A0AAP0DY06_9MAGN